jgi:lipopolysaccharide/colanic/teichoic acid biosynthesis glycosyltransferase
MNQFDTLHDLRSEAPDKHGLRAPQTRAQRGLDLVLASAALVLLSPVFVLVASAIWLEGRNPVIFRQPRRDPEGRTFHSYRFRTTRVVERGARGGRAADGGSQVTQLGVVLRTLRLDDLPQLFNVIRGEMSLVGPRPHGTPRNQA